MFPEKQLTLIDKIKVAEDTYEFVFDKPKDFTYKAGQYVGIHLNVGETRAENIKSFSLSTAPYEPLLTVTMRINLSPFKQKMASFKKGDKINIQGPFGNFTVRPGDEDKEIYFLAQGIGITPFVSIIKQNTNNKAKQPMTLFYQNSTFERTAYLEELNAIQKNNKYFFYHLFIPLSEQLTLMNAKPNEKLFFLCGSEPAITSYKQLLDRAGIGKKNIRVEEFPGYI